MAKKPKAHLSAKVELKVTASQLRGKVDKAKVRSRGPGHIGQMKLNKVIHLGDIPQPELVKRIEMAAQILTTGKIPAAAKSKGSGRSDTTKKETTTKEPGTKIPEKAKDKAAPVTKTGTDKPETTGEKDPTTPPKAKK